MDKKRKNFFRKVEKIPWTGCWVWLGSTATKGRYGYFHLEKNVLAHRASWMLFKGEIPPKMCVCHSCDVTLCVNPDHLFLGTHKQNTQDMILKGRHRYGTWNAPKGEKHWTKRKAT